MSTDLKIGKYRHYKRGGIYEVIGVARHSETEELMVVYRALYDSDEFGLYALWVRPLTSFLERVTIEGEEKPRFEYIDD